MRTIGNVTAYYTEHDFPSHFYKRRFTYRGYEFPSVEHFLMFCKARLFGDVWAANEILKTPDCQTAKMLGRSVQGYVDEVWVHKRMHYAFVGNREKYLQNRDLADLLIKTYPNTLVEASKRDTIWGVGLTKTDDRIGDPHQWLGQNLHGQVQEQVREFLILLPSSSWPKQSSF